MTKAADPYTLCREVNGRCACAERAQGPCAAMQFMVDALVDADMETDRIARGREAGARGPLDWVRK